MLALPVRGQTPLPVPGNLTPGTWQAQFSREEIHGSRHHLSGSPGSPAQIRDERLLFRAQEIDYDQDTGDLVAAGDVYYHNFLSRTEIWASRVEYNTEDETGRFYDVRGDTHPRILPRPGVLYVDAPFHFQGDWAERIGSRYVLHNGWGTNCTLPKPWWRLRARRVEIVPAEHVTAYRSVFVLRKMPLFYAPFFYHSLEEQPRKSGFLLPNIVPHSRRGFMVGLGYYWAINRSYDAMYRFQDYNTSAFAHNLDFRARPRADTSLDAVLWGVQDRGKPDSGDPPQKFSGVSLYAAGRADLGHGFLARGFGNYITSFRFRQEWSESYYEAIGSEIHSVGVIERNWRQYSFDVTIARLQNFQTSEVAFTDPETGQSRFITNAVNIRKLPEAAWTGRDRQFWSKLPLWFSFDSVAGLLHRDEPIFDASQKLIGHYQTGDFTSRVHLAPHLTGSLHLAGFHLVPSIGFQETFYSETQGLDPNNPGLYRVLGTNIFRSARDFSVELIFPSVARIFNQKTVFGDKLKHVIEPRATYRYVTGIGTDFNRFIRFDETDLLSNTNEVEYSLTNRVYSKRGDSVREIFTWELAQKRYFDPTFGGALIAGQRNVFASTAGLSAYAFLVGPRSSSPVVSLLRTNPVGGLGIQWQADYDPHAHGIVDSAFSLDYRWQKYVIYAGNNEVHTDPRLTPAANQFRFGAGWGDGNRRGWNGRAEFLYDYREGSVQYTTAQVTYNTDCCGLSVQYRRNGINGESQVRIAFAVANIATFGTLRKERMF